MIQLHDTVTALPMLLEALTFPANGFSSYCCSMIATGLLFMGTFPPFCPLPLGIVAVASLVIFRSLFCFQTVLTKSDNVPVFSVTCEHNPDEQY